MKFHVAGTIQQYAVNCPEGSLSQEDEKGKLRGIMMWQPICQAEQTAAVAAMRYVCGTSTQKTLYLESTKKERNLTSITS